MRFLDSVYVAIHKNCKISNNTTKRNSVGFSSNKFKCYSLIILFLLLAFITYVMVFSQQQYVVNNIDSYKGNNHFKNTGKDLSCIEPTLVDITEEESSLTLAYLSGMTQNEKVLLLRKFRNASYYFEYGCGGSTVLACKTGTENFKMVSVDSSKEWLANVQNDSCITDSQSSNRVRLHHIDLGTIEGFGYPADGSAKSKWHSYSSVITKYDPESIDLVLVDGRFRVASALQALLSVKPGVEVIFHDFFGRKQYFPVLHFADIVDCQDTLVVLRRKESVSDAEIKKYLHKFVRNPF